ncbi:MAG: glycosyltransferase [Pyrinomonadaceae bacterium]|nr:glycosyltransferase [Pyrinomonadaceae bacterium]
MRIFLAVRHSINPEFYYGGLWSGNFYPALRRLGHEIIESEVDLLPASRFMHIAGDFTPLEKETRACITERIIEEVRHAHHEKPLDLFLCYFYNAHFDPAGFDEIHRLGIPTVNFYCNSIYQFELIKDVAQRAQFSWHAERDAQSLYKNVGANPVWVQMGADPDVYRPHPQKARQAKACFIGQRYADRDRLLVSLISESVPVDIYGGGWDKNYVRDSLKSADGKERSYLGRELVAAGSVKSYAHAGWQNFRRHGIVGGVDRNARQLIYRSGGRKLDALLACAARGFARDVSETFARYELVLNFSNVWADGRPGSQLIAHVRLRDFEAPMCRTCYLTGATDEIEEFYEVGKEIDTYTCSEELIDKTKFYLSHPARAEALREAGYRRASRDHTWERRFEHLFDKIGLAHI